MSIPKSKLCPLAILLEIPPSFSLKNSCLFVHSPSCPHEIAASRGHGTQLVLRHGWRSSCMQCRASKWPLDRLLNTGCQGYLSFLESQDSTFLLEVTVTTTLNSKAVSFVNWVFYLDVLGRTPECWQRRMVVLATSFSVSEAKSLHFCFVLVLLVWFCFHLGISSHSVPEAALRFVILLPQPTQS